MARLRSSAPAPEPEPDSGLTWRDFYDPDEPVEVDCTCANRDGDQSAVEHQQMHRLLMRRIRAVRRFKAQSRRETPA